MLQGSLTRGSCGHLGVYRRTWRERIDNKLARSTAARCGLDRVQDIQKMRAAGLWRARRAGGLRHRSERMQDHPQGPLDALSLGGGTGLDVRSLPLRMGPFVQIRSMY
jgi:hypothetical protein